MSDMTVEELREILLRPNEKQDLVNEYLRLFVGIPRFVLERFGGEELKDILRTCIEKKKPYTELFMTKEERDEYSRLARDPNILFDG